MLQSSVPAALRIHPCAATAAAHAGAVLGVLPFTNKASTEPCALHHLPPPHHCLGAAVTQHILILQAGSQQNQPHILSALSFTPLQHGGQGHSNTTAEPGAAPGFILLCQGQAMQQYSRTG